MWLKLSFRWLKSELEMVFYSLTFSTTRVGSAYLYSTGGMILLIGVPIQWYDADGMTLTELVAWMGGFANAGIDF